MRRSGTACAITVMAMAGVVAAATQPARADTVADFYRGKTVSMIVSTSAGNDYDMRARLLARHMGRFIPGAPQIVARNMPGGGGVVAANWLAKLAPRDGATLMMIMSNMMAAQRLDVKGVAFDTRKFRWIGNTTRTPNVVNAWHTAGVTSIEDVKRRELVVGAPIGSAGSIYPVALNAIAGTKFKVVTGYPGGNEVNLAMERGEVQGRGSNSWASWKSTRPQWLAEKKIVILAQVGLERAPDLPDVPLLTELAGNDLDRGVMRFLSADTAIARAIVTTEGVPPERLEALRRAFDATMRDADFLADAEKAQMDISPLSGEEAQKIADAIANAPDDVIARAREILGPLLR